MKVEAVALSDFIHGDINATEGKLCRHRSGELIDSGLAGDLERAGLVRIRMAPTRSAAPAPDQSGKAPDDGGGQPSSALPAAPASPTTMSRLLKTGETRPRKSGG